ncbi:hematopoietic death receptor isoform X2 [Hippoglossus hippoglossus]|uniref:hematopoietic death receptor isoform X2 n=1 Tax=Hippoglossus hippoglossus TaxID=8267 RepID=UPI00148DCBDE|nr:hematopoietic death receptor isoform X2 [Hippoglossus hippoglossus]
MTFISTSFSVLVLLLSTTGVFPRPGIDFGSRTQRDVHCTGNLEYPNGNKCCLNCPAGMHVTSHCIKTGERGQCQECDYETYTEHPNHLNQCLKCTKCRLDQDVVRHCMPTQDTECQCKAGRFCDPHQACEICKRCSKCEKDEEIERNCTSTTNTECKKIQPSSGSGSASASANTPVIVIIVISSLVVVAGGVAVFIWKKCRSTDTGRDLPEEIKVEQHYTDSCPTEERGYGETRRPSSSHWPLKEEDFPKLNPVNGEESLRKCFEYFEDMEIDQHKRFFRNLGIRDNVIKSKELLPYEDKIHELLNIWVEKEGREASLNDLLKALLDLKQRQTAETVMGKAIQDGHYVECPSESEILY